MQLVPPRQQDTENGYSWVIQNVYKVRNIVPQAMPKPVSIDQGLQLLRDCDSGVGDNSADQVHHPSKWTDSTTFDPLAFLDTVSYFKTPAILKPIVRTSPAKATPPKLTAGRAAGSHGVTMTTKAQDSGATAHAFASLASSVISTPRTESSGGSNGLNDLLRSLQNRESRNLNQPLNRGLFPNWHGLKAVKPGSRLAEDILYEALEDDDNSETESLPPLALQRFNASSFDDSDTGIDGIMSPDSSSQNSPPAISGSLNKRKGVAVQAPKPATVAATTRTGTGKRARASVDDTVSEFAPIKRVRTGRSKGTIVAADDVIEID